MKKFINYLKHKRDSIKNTSYEKMSLWIAVGWLIAMLIFLSLPTKSQVYTDWSTGYDFTQNSTVGAITFGFTKKIDVDGGISFSFNRGVQSNNFMHFRAGYVFFGMIVPQVGYYYNLRSSDDKTLNYSAMGYSLKFILPLTHVYRDNGSGFYLQGLYVNNQVQVLAGLHAVLW